MADSTPPCNADRRIAHKLASTSRCLYRRLCRHLLWRFQRAFSDVLSRPMIAARYAAAGTRHVQSPDRLHRARRAARLGVGRMPQRPGLWVRTTGDGDQRLYRVKDHNGQLYATVGRLLPIAVPTARLPGYWDHVG